MAITLYYSTRQRRLASRLCRVLQYHRYTTALPFLAVPTHAGDNVIYVLHLKINRLGAYLISTGCGAGKTEGIKELIGLKQDEGVIYCVDTKAEVDKMYNYLKDNGIVAEIDMLRLHGDAKTELDAYRDHPEAIMQKKVILLTHVRFWSDLIHYFLIYNPPTIPGAFDGDFKALMMRGDLRKWVLFDEVTLFFLPFAKISRVVLGCLSEKVGKSWKCKAPVDMKDCYMKFVDSTPDAITKSDHKLARLKRDTTLAIIPRFYNAWVTATMTRRWSCNSIPLISAKRT